MYEQYVALFVQEIWELYNNEIFCQRCIISKYGWSLFYGDYLVRDIVIHLIAWLLYKHCKRIVILLNIFKQWIELNNLVQAYIAFSYNICTKIIGYEKL